MPARNKHSSLLDPLLGTKNEVLFLTLPTNITLGWKCLPGTNTLAESAHCKLQKSLLIRSLACLQVAAEQADQEDQAPHIPSEKC
jgi:hypothetical protein